MKCLMLAAGLGRRLYGDENKELPKALLEFDGKTLLHRHINTLLELGMTELTIVVGHGKDALKTEAFAAAPEGFIKTIFNPRYTESPMISLWAARDVLRSGSDILFMDADVLYHPELLQRLIYSRYENCFLLDRNFEDGEDPVKVCIRNSIPVDFGKKVNEPFDVVGEWPGFMRMTPDIADKVASRTEGYLVKEPVNPMYEEAIRDIVRSEPLGTFGSEDITGIPWIEIDFPEDLIKAKHIILPKLGSLDDKKILKAVPG